MKKDFVALVKEIRITLRPEFLKIIGTSAPVTSDQMDKLIDELEAKRLVIITEYGYTYNEFLSLVKEYSMNFTSANPEEWVIKHDPENAGVIGPSKLM